MAQPLYSIRFFTGFVANGFGGGLYTVPAGKRAVLRDVDGTGTTSANTTFIGREGDAAYPICLLVGFATTVGTPWRGRQIFEAGEVIDSYAYTSGLWLMLSGYLLSAS